TTSATTRASATSPPPMSTTAAGTRSWPKERRSQTGPYSNDGTTIGPAGSERRPPRCPLTKGPKSPKVADDVHPRLSVVGHQFCVIGVAERAVATAGVADRRLGLAADEPIQRPEERHNGGRDAVDGLPQG